MISLSFTELSIVTSSELSVIENSSPSVPTVNTPLTVAVPPTYRFSPVEIPPVTFNAPVVALVADAALVKAVSLSIFNVGATRSRIFEPEL